MSIMRIHKSKDYTVISNYHFKEKDMSLKAKGLLSLMLSLPNDWDYSIGGLCTICKENETAIRNTLKELEDFKYLIRTRKQNEKGQFEYDYHIFEKPNSDEPLEEKPYTENPHADNQGQLNTNILNTNNKKENNIINNIVKEKSEKKSKFIPPTKEEIEKYCNEKGYYIDVNYFYEYYSAGNWMDAEGKKVKNWKQRVVTWNRRNNAANQRMSNKTEVVYERVQC